MQISQKKILVSQLVEPLEFFTGLEAKNKYLLLDSSKNKLFYAYEESNFLKAQYMGGARPLRIVICDKKKKPLLYVNRKNFSFVASYEVSLPDGTHLGYVRQKSAASAYSLNIFDAQDNLLLFCKSQLPRHPWGYSIMKDDVQIATIHKIWSGTGKEVYSDKGSYEVDFMSIKDDYVKQMLLATVFTIDLVRYESGRGSGSTSGILLLVHGLVSAFATIFSMFFGKRKKEK